MDGTSGASGLGRVVPLRLERWLKIPRRVEGRRDVVWSGSGSTARSGS
jgi:hypothetical protein